MTWKRSYEKKSYNIYAKSKSEGNTIAKQKKVRINEDIRTDDVRLILQDGEQGGVVSLQEALKLSEDVQLDLVEISPNAEPPVCRIMNYGKFVYAENKKKQEAKKKQKQVVIKEVKLRPVTDVGDLQVKTNQLAKFLSAGNKCKVTMRFRGREMAFPDQGAKVLNGIALDLEHLADLEVRPRMEGRQMIMVLTPKK